MTNSHKQAGSSAMIDRMAQIMVEVGDGASERDLLTRGFTQDEIAAFGPRASTLASQIATSEVA